MLLHGEHEAVVDGERRLTWADLARRVGGLSTGLAELGIERGAVVAVLMRNCLEHLECWLGLPSGGLVLNTLNVRLTLTELAFILDDCEAVALITDDAFLTTARELADRCASVHHLIYAGVGESPEDTRSYAELVATTPLPPPRVSGDDLAGIFYTGGTSGLPKGVMLTHGNLVANAKHMLIAMGYQPRDRYLHAGPMFHLADGSCTYALTWVGATHVTVPSFEPRLVAAAIEAERITAMVLVPTMINMLVNHPAVDEHDLRSLRYLIYGGAPMPKEVLRRTMQTLDCEPIQVYGMTEVAPIATICRMPANIRELAEQPHWALRLRSAGIPLVGVEVDVRCPDGSRAQANIPGEVWVRGPNVMAGYWHRPQETASAIDADGWYHTGDVAYADENGYLYVVDRLKDMIISGGENVYSTEVENAIYQHPAVLEAVVFGVPDERWGERVHAVVVLREPDAVTELDLVEHCRTMIAGYKLPRSMELRTTPLPKTGAGKILKRELREPYWADREARVS